jgi:muramoyltetrapeptide carboxypeptidase
MTAPYLQRRYHCHLGNSQKNIDDNLRPAIDLLHSWGLKSLLAIHRIRYQLAGTDAQRAADFQQLDNPNIKAIWCVRRLWYGSNY